MLQVLNGKVENMEWNGKVVARTGETISDSVHWCMMALLQERICSPVWRANSCMSTIPGPEVIKLFSCSTQLSMKFFLLIYVKMPVIVGILTFMSRKNSILGLSKSGKS